MLPENGPIGMRDAQEKASCEREDFLTRTHLNEESLVRANAQFWEQMLGMQMDTVPFTENFLRRHRACFGECGSFGNVEGAH
jgi:hypothetical protein